MHGEIRRPGGAGEARVAKTRHRARTRTASRVTGYHALGWEVIAVARFPGEPLLHVRSSASSAERRKTVALRVLGISDYDQLVR